MCDIGDMRDRIPLTIGTNTYIINVKITFVSNAQREVGTSYLGGRHFYVMKFLFKRKE